MKKVFTVIEAFLFTAMLIAVAGLDGSGGDICGVIAIVAVVLLFIVCTVEGRYVFRE